MKFLKYLKLSRFNLVTIPNVIYNLKGLYYLALYYCEITEIQDKIENLSNLTKVNLSYNNIRIINLKIFKFQNLIKIILTNNPLYYLLSSINNDNLSFTLFISTYTIALFKQDDDNLGIMAIAYKKIHQIKGYKFRDISSMSINYLYKKPHNEEYIWKLNQMLKIKIKEVEESQDGYNIIINYWNALENYITDNDIKYKFFNYLQLLYGIKKRRKEETFGFIKDIKTSIKNYEEAIFKILTN